MVRFASFNVYGMGGRSVSAAVGFATSHFSPQASENSCIGFQEVWTKLQLADVMSAYCGAGAASQEHANVAIWRKGNGAWRCLVPKVPPVIGLELSSGLAFCVQGNVHDAFFSEYRGGALPDSMAKKGVLVALVSSPGQPKRALINTHLHDYSNDKFGKYRNSYIDVIISSVKWVLENWRVPVVMLGDFNIDSIHAYAKTDAVERACYQRLISAGLEPGKTFYDVNARVHQGKPIKTTGSRAIDHHLILDAGLKKQSFASLSTPHSDHCLTVSEST